MQTRLFYIDDSGAGQTGYAVYAWLTCDASAWTSGLTAWLQFRRSIEDEHGIPPGYELHTGQFLAGRGRPSRDPTWNLRRSNRIDVAQRALQVIARSDALTVGAAYRRFVKPTHLGLARAGLYRAVLTTLHDQLIDADSVGLIFVDGDGSDPTYQAAHRSLDHRSRRIIEDPLFQTSHRSQWMQMADLIAYAAYQSLVKDPARQFCWNWYDKYLRSSDPGAGPVEL